MAVRIHLNLWGLDGSHLRRSLSVFDNVSRIVMVHRERKDSVCSQFEEDTPD